MKNRRFLWSAIAALLCFLAGGALLLAGRALLFAALVLLGLGCLLAVLALSFRVKRRVVGRRIRRALLVLVALGGFLFGLLEGLILTFSCGTAPEQEPDAVVILGAALWEGEPSPVLTSRIAAGAEWLLEHPDVPVVVSGGVDTGETRSEAAVMAEELERRGVAPERIYLEERATNTVENLTYSVLVLEENDISFNSLLIVSSAPHLARVRLLASRCGLSADTLAAAVPGGWSYNAYLYLREGAALVKSFLFDHP